MRELGIAFVITSAASVGLFCILSLLLQLDDHVAEGMAGMPFVAIHHICEWLEHRPAKTLPAEKRGEVISSFEGYAKSWPIATAYGVMLVIGITSAASVYSGAAVTIIGASNQQGLGSSAGIVNIPIVLLGYYLVGIYAGSRCMSRGFLAILFIGLLGSVFIRSFDFIVMSPEDFSVIWQKDKTILTFLEFSMGGCLLFWVPGFLGYWRGTRLRLSRYLAYLLHVLPVDTRQTLVTLAYSEAQTLVARPVHPVLAIGQPA
jgi:hypothetical protein